MFKQKTKFLAVLYGQSMVLSMVLFKSSVFLRVCKKMLNLYFNESTDNSKKINLRQSFCMNYVSACAWNLLQYQNGYR